MGAVTWIAAPPLKSTSPTICSKIQPWMKGANLAMCNQYHNILALLVDGQIRTAENKNLSPLPQKKETPRAPPRYRPPQDSPQRSPPLNASVQSEVDQKPVKPEPKQVKPEPHRRRSPYDRSQYEPPEQVRLHCWLTTIYCMIILKYIKSTSYSDWRFMREKDHPSYSCKLKSKLARIA